MTVLQRIGQIEQSLDERNRAREFVHMLRYLVIARGDALQAEQIAKGGNLLPRIISAINGKRQIAIRGKSVVTPLSTENATAIADYDALRAAFMGSLAQASAFDRMLPDMLRVPLRSRVVLVSSGATGAIVGEGSPTRVSSLGLGPTDVDETHAVAMIAVSEETAKSDRSGDLLGSEVRKAVSRTTDIEFVSKITNGLTPVESTGGASAADVRADLGTALAAIDTDETSRLYVLVDS